MSIGGINGLSGWWQWQNQATQSAADITTGNAATSSISNSSISNTGSVAAGGTLSSFMQAFSADLQAMLSQVGGDATPAAGSATDGITSQTASQTQGTPHHRHHHHRDSAGVDGSMQGSANQLGEIGQSRQGGSLSADQINQSASVVAAEVMQALQSYGAATPSGAGTSILV